MPAYARACFMCNSKQLRKGKANCSFHKFPSDVVTRSRWLQFCNLTTADDASTLTVCSRHFTPNQFENYYNKELGGSLRLKKGAYPSITKPVAFLKGAAPSVSHTKLNSSVATVHMEPSLESSILSAVADVKVNLCTDAEVVEVAMEPGPVSFSDNRLQINEVRLAPTAPCDAATQTEVVLTTFIKETVVLENKGNLLENTPKPSSPKRRRFVEPRYIGDIKTSDLATPRRAKRSLRIAQESVYRQTRKIRTLQQTNRNLKKKVESMHALIHHLKTELCVRRGA